MKKLKTTALLVALVMSSGFANAQSEEGYIAPVSSRWISAKGFWVIESNIKTPKTATVHFYTNHQQLISSIAVEGRVLNIEKRKTLKTLKKALEVAVDSWAKNGSVKDEDMLVALLNADGNKN
ncbi:hypothetical protein [Ferruginibacter profundus]